jgi:hypothetical protein
MATSKDYYAILGVLPSIDPVALAAVYRALLKKYHPDVCAGTRADGERITKELNEAFSILGDPVRRAAYDKARSSDGPSSGDYEGQQDWERSGGEDGESQALDDWRYVVRYHPNVERYRNELKELSPALAFSFQVAIIEGKSFNQAASIATALKRQFLERYFGSNPAVHEFVLKALQTRRRDVALEVNRAIKILGSPDAETQHSFLRTVRDTTSWYEQVTPSPGTSKSSSTQSGQGRRALNGLALISLYYVIVAVLAVTLISVVRMK